MTKNLKILKWLSKLQKRKKQYAKQEKDQLEQEYDLSEKEIQNAFEELKESLESMPSTTKLAGLSVLDSIGGIVKSLLTGNYSPTSIVKQFRESHKTESEEDRA